MHAFWALGAPTHRLKRSQWVPGDIGPVFAFFEDPHNLERITPSWMSFTILSGSPQGMSEGAQITYRVAWMGVPMRWVTLIETWEPRRRFVDTALVSPYVLWRHEHTFEEVGGGVMLADNVSYRLPFGVLGSAVHALGVRRQLEAIFDHRARATADLMSGGVVLHAPAGAPP
jgi:ligand-binding SRPBCC domain-containing protein